MAFIYCINLGQTTSNAEYISLFKIWTFDGCLFLRQQNSEDRTFYIILTGLEAKYFFYLASK
jgi:hypothetical protein